MEERKGRIKDIVDKMKPIHVYGLVLDDEGQPVPKAEVKMAWTEANLLMTNRGHTKWIKADEKGRWKFVVNKAFLVDIMEVRGEGYEFDWKANPYFSEPQRTEIIKNTAKDDPLILFVRKKGETTHLLRSRGKLIRAKQNERGNNYFDFLQPRKRPVKGDEYNVDLEVNTEYMEQHEVWKITLRTEENYLSGIIASDERLYVAPAEGYKPVVEMTGPDYPKHVYLRSRLPSIYTRLDLEYFFRKVPPSLKAISISYESWTNPYGSRNLEFEQALESEWLLDKKLEREAKKVIKEGRRPKNPDLKKLIKEEKEKRQKKP